MNNFKKTSANTNKHQPDRQQFEMEFIERMPFIRRRFFTVPKIILCIFTAIGIAATVVFFVFGLNPISKYVKMAYVVYLVLIAYFWVLSIAYMRRHRDEMKIPVLFFSVVALVFLTVLIPSAKNFLDNGAKEYLRTTSPSGENTVIIMKSSGENARFTAYPLKYKYFYKFIKNGYVGVYESSNGTVTSIDWQREDKAYIYIDTGDFQQKPGSNINGIIVVLFK